MSISQVINWGLISLTLSMVSTYTLPSPLSFLPNHTHTACTDSLSAPTVSTYIIQIPSNCLKLPQSLPVPQDPSLTFMSLYLHIRLEQDVIGTFTKSQTKFLSWLTPPWLKSLWEGWGKIEEATSTPSPKVSVTN